MGAGLLQNRPDLSAFMGVGLVAFGAWCYYWGWMGKGDVRQPYHFGGGVRDILEKGQNNLWNMLVVYLARGGEIRYNGLWHLLVIGAAF